MFLWDITVPESLEAAPGIKFHIILYILFSGHTLKL